jgi:hypothetical protein
MVQMYSSEGVWNGKYEQSLRRGELVLDYSVVEQWRKELRSQNRGKVGEPYQYPEPFIKLLGFIRLTFRLPYRQMETFVKALSNHATIVRAPDHSTLGRRIRRLDIKVEDELVNCKTTVVIAVNAEGIRVHSEADESLVGEGSRKGYLKVHFTVNTRKREVVSMDVATNGIQALAPLSRN